MTSSYLCALNLNNNLINKIDFGKKGYNLYLLKTNGFKIPNGYILSNFAFDTFLEFNSLKKQVQEFFYSNESEQFAMNENLIDSIQRGEVPYQISLEIEEVLKDFSTTSLAIRSSSSNEDGYKNSFSGIYQSFLFIVPSIDCIVLNIKKCWCSLFSNLAIHYRQKIGFTGIDKMSVIIQEMIKPLRSGTTFTVSPLNNKLLIHEIYCGVQSDYSIPQSYSIDRNNENIIKFPTNEPISKQLISKLTKECLDIEKLFSEPQDIEWCINENDDIYFLQSRSILNILNKNLNYTEGNFIVKGISACPGFITGIVRIVNNPIDALNLYCVDDILVTESTSPIWITYMTRVKGIITNEGGILCHTANVAREFNIPCIVGAINATEVLRNGMKVLLNADLGLVYEIKDL